MIFATASGKHRNLRRPGRRPGPVKYGLLGAFNPSRAFGGKPIKSRNLRCPGRPPDPVFCGIPGALGTCILRAQNGLKKHCPSERFLGGSSKWRVLRAIPWDPLGSRFVGSGGGLEHRKKGCRGMGHVRSVVFYAVPGAPGVLYLRPFGPAFYVPRGASKKGCHSAAFFGGRRKVSYFTLSRAPFWTRIL